jgi:hypothetical protein
MTDREKLDLIGMAYVRTIGSHNQDWLVYLAPVLEQVFAEDDQPQGDTVMAQATQTHQIQINLPDGQALPAAAKPNWFALVFDLGKIYMDVRAGATIAVVQADIQQLLTDLFGA